MRIFKTRLFNKWAIKEKLSDNFLINAVEEMSRGLIDANLGGNLYKKRIAKVGQGKSGSTRTILAFKVEDKAFFVYGFAKKDKDNISDKELEILKILASGLLDYDNEKIEKTLKEKKILEVIYE